MRSARARGRSVRAVGLRDWVCAPGLAADALRCRSGENADVLHRCDALAVRCGLPTVALLQGGYLTCLQPQRGLTIRLRAVVARCSPVCERRDSPGYLS